MTGERSGSPEDERFAPLQAGRFASLQDAESVFRLITPGSSLLPAGQRLPLPDWLAPSSADCREAEHRGRRPGLSVWRTALASTGDVRALTGREAARAFEANVGKLRATSRVPDVEPVDVVSDPDDNLAPGEGWHAHALIEGLKAPSGANKNPYRQLRTALVACFDEVE